MAPTSATYAVPPVQLGSVVHGTATAWSDHDLAPVMGLATGLGAALVLWTIPVVTWLLLR